MKTILYNTIFINP
jgi:hypothetical protein